MSALPQVTGLFGEKVSKSCLSLISSDYDGHMENNTTTKTTKRARKSRCNHCSSAITEKALINAIDIEAHTDAYGYEVDELVWLDQNKNAMCYGTQFSTAHATDKEVCGN